MVHTATTPHARHTVPPAPTGPGTAGTAGAAAAGNPLLHRIFAVIIAVAALLVAWLGLAQPLRLDRAFTWAQLPPLHANFVGCLYLFGAVLVGGSGWARHRSQWGPVIGGIAIFTTSMLVLTVLNTEAFDWDLPAVRGWVISYVVYPPIAWALALWTARRPMTSPGGVPITRYTRALLLTTAAVFGVLGAALLVVRSPMADAWPWPVSDGVAQFYGGPFLAIAWVAYRFSRRGFRADLLIYAPSMTVLAVSVLYASFDHRQLFSVSTASCWVWFIGFFGVAASHGALTVDSWRHRPGRFTAR